MNQPLYVHTDGVRSLSDVHDAVSTAVSQLAGARPLTETNFGTIASGFTSALGRALPSRDGTLQATSTSGQTIRDLLRRAGELYDQGDQGGAEKLRAAAEAMAGSEGGGPGAGAGNAGGATGSGGACSAGAGAATGGGGGDQAGQLAGQVGQQVGQIASTMAQSVQGLAQGLTQLPQQIMQGVQGIVSAATQGAGSTEAKLDAKGDKATGGKATDPEGTEPDPESRRREEADAAEREQERTRNAPSGAPQDGAQPGTGTTPGRAPAPPVERPQPAQTRPQ